MLGARDARIGIGKSNADADYNFVMINNFMLFLKRFVLIFPPSKAKECRNETESMFSIVSIVFLVTIFCVVMCLLLIVRLYQILAVCICNMGWPI